MPMVWESEKEKIDMVRNEIIDREEEETQTISELKRLEKMDKADLIQEIMELKATLKRKKKDINEYGRTSMNYYSSTKKEIGKLKNQLSDERAKSWYYFTQAREK